MTKYYWNKLSKVADFALDKMHSLRPLTKVNKIRWAYYESIVNRSCKEREEDLEKRRTNES